MSTITAPRERIPTEVFAQAEQASVAVAGEIAALIRGLPGRGKPCVLGWPPAPRRPASMPNWSACTSEEGLSFNVVTFNLDEYFPMQPSELQSYRRFMHEHLFDHVDIR